ncbi:MAG: ABC transporter permease [Saprospiraceae bacterium]|nr:ABC transporter permease [Saprospiraceae bacterium]
MGPTKPPKWADWLIEKICPEEYLEEVQGDLHEAFYWREETKGLPFARRKFYLETFKTFRLFRFRKPGFMNNPFFYLLKNYFKTGFRFIWKTRTYSFINMSGLAIGIATAAMAYLFLADQYSFDRFHDKSDRLYRIGAQLEFRGETEKMGGASYIMGKTLPEEVPGIEMATHVKNGIALRLIDQDYSYLVFHYADPQMFQMLDFNFIKGTPGAFEDPENIVVSRSFAKTLPASNELRLLFGEEEKVFSVTGIYEDFPMTSTFRPSVIIPFNFWVSRVAARRTESWFDINMNVFVLRREGAALEDVEAGMNEILAANLDSDMASANPQLFLQPFSKMHTDKLEMGNGLRATANLQVLWVVLLVGLLCLLISCFNYSNFALGNFLSRSQEVAVRKVMGANRNAIFQQFLSESFLGTIMAGVLAFLLIQALLPVFSQFVGVEYGFRDLLSWRFGTGLALVLLISTFLSGLYPSVVLSAKKANLALKERLKVGGKSFFSWFLVMMQVSITIFLIIGMLTTNQQLDHLLNFDLGYEDENVLALSIRDTSEQRLDQMHRELERLAFVQSVSSNSGYNGTDYKDGEIDFSTSHLRTDENFIDLLNIEMVEGRNFDLEIQADQAGAVLVNETFVKRAQLNNPVGEVIPFDYGRLTNPRIIGVVKDFHYEALQSEIQPLVIYTAPEYMMQTLLIKLNPQSSQQEIGQIEALWRQIYPTRPINYTYLEESNAADMQTETQIQRLARSGSLIAILLASLGLFGMVGTHVRQRLKEVSIRKVNGATPLDIYLLFSSKFGKWLVSGFIIGTIPAIYFLNNWLNNYPERIQLSWGIPMLSAFICAAVFLTIITLLLIRVMNLNPATHLKDE